MHACSDACKQGAGTQAGWRPRRVVRRLAADGTRACASVLQNDLDYATRFLHMLFAWPTCSYEVDPVLARALDKILILCAFPRLSYVTAAFLVGTAGFRTILNTCALHGSMPLAQWYLQD